MFLDNVHRPVLKNKRDLFVFLWPPLWPSGQSSWLLIQRSRIWEVVGLERGPLSLLRITEELLGRKVAAPVSTTEINSRGDSLCWPRDTLYPLKFALPSPTIGGRSVGIVRWRTKAPELKLTGRVLDKERTTDNVQKHNICIRNLVTASCFQHTASICVPVGNSNVFTQDVSPVSLRTQGILHVPWLRRVDGLQ
jgi:hypothetical protein